MASYTSLVCAACGKRFQALTKEVNRQNRRGKKVRFCSLSCASIENVKFREAALEYSRSEENSKHLNANCRNRADEYSDFRMYIRRARRRGKLDDITVEYLKELWDSQNGKCAVTGVNLVHGGSNRNYMASVDRIDSSIPYRIGNVRFISVTANYAKNDGGENNLMEFFAIVKNLGH